MAKLKMTDRKILEKLFQMEKGRVLDFSDRTFREFFQNELGVDIEAEKYCQNSGSKANRLRAFWELENEELVAKSIEELIDYIESLVLVSDKEYRKYEIYPLELREKGQEIAERLYSHSELDYDIESASQAEIGINGELKLYPAAENRRIRAKILEVLQKYGARGLDRSTFLKDFKKLEHGVDDKTLDNEINILETEGLLEVISRYDSDTYLNFLFLKILPQKEDLIDQTKDTSQDAKIVISGNINGGNINLNSSNNKQKYKIKNENFPERSAILNNPWIVTIVGGLVVLIVGTLIVSLIFGN